MDYYEIGQRIRRIRKAKGISQEVLAEKVGESRGRFPLTHFSCARLPSCRLISHPIRKPPNRTCSASPEVILED
ncbi:MAG: helix-turn-helix transcriptional regulator [Clostridia bacterium]|nr:helix-turn-helix transcriptional regulator [Clostridia bacterium]